MSLKQDRSESFDGLPRMNSQSEDLLTALNSESFVGSLGRPFECRIDSLNDRMNPNGFERHGYLGKSPSGVHFSLDLIEVNAHDWLCFYRCLKRLFAHSFFTIKNFFSSVNRK